MRRNWADKMALVSEPFVKSHRLPSCGEFVFGGWDSRGEDLLQSASRNAVIEAHRLKPIARELAGLRAWKPDRTRLERDIERFRRAHKLETVVVLNLLPTGAHGASKAYAKAANDTGCPFINFTPNDCAEEKLTGIPFCGRDGKTGQTWLKSVLAPALRSRQLRVTGWYSTNLLGNEDGKVVGDPIKGEAKIRDKTKLLGEMLGYEPHHLVQINYFPPRGDTKESWDFVEFEGFLGMPMQLRISGAYRDSILAAPMCVDLVRFMALAARQGERGAQSWLSYFFKAPYGMKIHDFHRQERVLLEFLKAAV
jgi:myo-inositol-1-phosphate synthase